MSNVSNAIGTQKQFSPMPQGTYEKRLHSVNIAANTSNDGLLLAKSLGVLGDALATEGLSQEKRREQLGIAEAERIISSRSEEDMKKLTAIEMINNYGNFETADNPYAISTIEKMRGKYFGAKAKNQYDTEVVQAQGRAKTPEEEVARYNKFIQDKYGEYIKTTSDEKAFNKGFYDNHIVDQLETANNQIKYKSQELDAIRIGTTQAELSKIVETAHTMSKEDILSKFNEVMDNNRMANASIPERIQQAKQFLKDLTEMTGDYQKVEHIMDAGVLGVDGSGAPVHVGSVVDGQDFKRAAELRTRQLFGERVQSDILALQKMTPAEVNKQFDTWQRDDPEWFNVMTGYRDNIFTYHQQVEKRKQIEETKQNISKAVRQASFSHLENQWNAYQAGNNKDAMGYVVAASYGDLPQFEYQTVDSQGDVVTKKYSWSKEDVNLYVDNKLSQIINNPSLTPEERSAETMRLLSWPPAKHYSDSIKMQLTTALDSLTVDKLKTDSSGKAVLTGQAQDAIQMYRTDPEAFQHLFGSHLTTEMETLQLLTQATGDTREGVNLYAQGRDKRRDNELVNGERGIKAQVSRYLASERLQGFLGIDGQEVAVNTSLVSNRSVSRRVEALAQNLMYAGMPADRAVETAMEKTRSSTYVWKDTAIPRSIFNGIMTENKATVGKAVLEYYLDSFAKSTGVDPAFISTEYDIDRNVLTISGGGGHVTYNVNDITYSGNYLLQEWAKNPPQGRDITFEELMELRNRFKPITPAPSSDLTFAGWDSNVTQSHRGDRP